MRKGLKIHVSFEIDSDKEDGDDNSRRTKPALGAPGRIHLVSKAEEVSCEVEEYGVDLMAKWGF